jgi:L-seryl-tRNA(Ser) seleniumtransferase
VLAALQDTALAYLHRRGEAIPFWRMATTPVVELRRRAAAIGVGDVVECSSVPGGGTLPGVEIPSVGLAVDGDHAPELRTASPPVIARVGGGRTTCDLRTVDPEDDAVLARALAALSGRRRP